jgi:hypothetical protein
VFPNPVYAFRRFVSEVCCVEISAEKQHKDNLIAIGGLVSWLILVASSLRRLLTLVKSPEDLASISKGR